MKSADFQPGEEHLYLITPHEDPTIRAQQTVMIASEYWLKGPFSYELLEPNICVLDLAKYRIGNEGWQEEEEILKIDQAIRKRFGVAPRGGMMVQPWFSKRKVLEELGTVSLQFEFFVEEVPTTDLELIVERTEQYGHISINDYRLQLTHDAKWWIDKCFTRIPFPKEHLAVGKNQVTLAIHFHARINLEAIYIAGAFGVRLNGCEKTLVKLPEKMAVGDLTVQGFPFYTGKILYNTFIHKQKDKDTWIF